VRGHERVELELQRHREAVASCAAAIRAVPASAWTRERAAGKWTPAQIAEHLRIAYDPLLSEVGGGTGMALRLPWWKRRLVRWRFLGLILRGGFPKNAPAPREIRPTGHSASPEEAAQRLSENAEQFLDRLGEAARRGPVRLTHPYFGGLSTLQILQLLTSHARHHQSQLPGEARDNPPTSKG
jgi:uncharacterized damage-inducible protein DinB